MARIKDQAICIRLIDWSETSQIVVLLSKEHGKLKGLAKGSKRSSPSNMARFSGGLELLTGGQVLCQIKPTTELAQITEWDLQKPWWHLRKNWESYQLALYGADLTQAILADHDPHPVCFDALANFLETLANRPTQQRALLEFQWTLLNDCGYRPDLHHDIQTQEPLPTQDIYTFLPNRGGFTAQQTKQHATQEPNTWGVRQQTLSLLQKFADPASLPLANDDPTLVRANRLLCVYTRSILDQQLATMRFILGDLSDRTT